MRPLIFIFALTWLMSGCIHVTMAPIEVHAVVDVNVKMEQAVTDLIGDIYGDSATVKTDVLKPRP